MEEMLNIVIAIGMAVAIPEPQMPPAPVQKADTVEGGYTVVSGEVDGKPIPAAELEEAVVRITRGEVIGNYKNLLYFLAESYTIDATATPWRIEMKSVAPVRATPGDDAPKEKTVLHGLIKKEDDIVTLIYALPGAARPTDFKTKRGQMKFVLQSFASGPQPPSKFAK